MVVDRCVAQFRGKTNPGQGESESSRQAGNDCGASKAGFKAMFRREGCADTMPADSLCSMEGPDQALKAVGVFASGKRRTSPSG